VLLTLGGVALVLALIGGGITTYYVYDRQASKLEVAQERADDLERQRDQVRTALGQQIEKTRTEYSRGLRVGRESERRLNRSIGLDFDSAYNAAFDGFGGWQIDTYYFVRIIKGDGKLKYDIASRGLFEPCTAYFSRGDSIWTQDGPC
jgi:hypothetical protein